MGHGRVPQPDGIGAEPFHRYFDDKVAGVRSMTADDPPPLFSPTSAVVTLSQFRSVTVDDACTVMQRHSTSRAS